MTIALIATILCLLIKPTYKLEPKDINIQNVCKEFNITCDVVVYNKEPINAYVTEKRNTIYVHKYLVNKYGHKKLLPVYLHELGHIVLKHIPSKKAKMAELRKEYGNNIPTPILCKYLREQEIEADIFAELTLRRLGSKYLLSDTLKKLVPKESRDFRTCTHPSINERLKTLERL